MATPISGTLVFLDESSNMGGFWAFIPDNSFNPFPSDTYILHDGDQLTVSDANNANVLWSGVIKLQPVTLMTQGVQGFWIRNLQTGVDLKQWATWFIGRFPAKLITTNTVNQYPNYPG